jgi:hypothetical protein
MSLPVIRIEETPSPARAGRSAGLSRVGYCLDPERTVGIAAGKRLEQEEGLGQHVILRHRLQRRNVETGEDLLHFQRQAARTAAEFDNPVAGVEQHRSSAFHVGVDAADGGGEGMSASSLIGQ